MGEGSLQDNGLPQLLAGLRGARAQPRPSELTLLELRQRIHERARRSLAPNNPLRARLDSEDLTQETLLHLVEVVDRFRGSTWAEFLVFVDRVMVQRRTDLARRHQRRKRAAPPGSRVPAAATVDDASPSPSQSLAARESQERIRQGVESLPEPFRTTVRQRLTGTSYEEIARRCGISPANARQRFSRGLEMLRRQLDE